MDLFEFLKDYKLPGGRIIFAKVWGSHSHNTNLPTSDVDFTLVFAAPARHVMGIREVVDTISTTMPDCQAHEVRKFAGLLLKGNPGIFEMLFTERSRYVTEPWNRLVEVRNRFKSRNVVKQYLGYARSQLEKLETGGSVHARGGEYGEKWAYHLIRLLLDARRIAAGGDPVVWKEGWERELLMSVRTNAMPREEVVKLARNLEDEVDSMAPWPLPGEGDAALLDEWVYGMRKEELS